MTRTDFGRGALVAIIVLSLVWGVFRALSQSAAVNLSNVASILTLVGLIASIVLMFRDIRGVLSRAPENKKASAFIGRVTSLDWWIKALGAVGSFLFAVLLFRTAVFGQRWAIFWLSAPLNAALAAPVVWSALKGLEVLLARMGKFEEPAAQQPVPAAPLQH